MPVGSSASTIAGRPTSARAIATRWRSPPESWVGRAAEPVAEPDRASSASAARSRRSRDGHARVEQTVGDVLERGRVLGEEELLEDEADPRRAHRRELAVGQLGDVEAGDPDPPGARPVERAHQCSSVDFPEPDGPTIATQLAASTLKLTPCERDHRRLRPVASSSTAARARATGRRAHVAHRRHHDALAGGEAAAAHLDEPVGVVEQAELDRHQAVGAAGADLLDRVAAAGEREQRVHRDDERVLDAARS